VRRFCALAIMVVMINATWHFFRVWLSPLLRELHYDEPQRNLFTTAYYLAAGLGSLTAGLFTLLMARRGVSVHVSRLVVFLAYGLLTALALWAAFLPAGPLLLGVLLLVAFGSLGVFPPYYSFCQDLTVKHLGKVTAFLGFFCWIALAGWQELIAHVKTYTHSFTACMVLAAVLPLVGFAAMLLLWGRNESKAVETGAEPIPDQDGSPAEPATGIRSAGGVDGVLAPQAGGVTR
jgi:ACS family hexuronate transporter-like MFS transporter